MENYVHEVSFEEFGYREIREVTKLLNEYLNSNIDINGLKVAFNANSGYVFLSDEDYNVWMLNDGKLEQFYNCSNCGYEGFKDEFTDNKNCPECKENVIYNDEDDQ